MRFCASSQRSRLRPSVALLSAAAAGIGGAAVVLAAAPTGAAENTPPVTSAYGLVDSVGVNVHMYFQDTSYANTSGTISLLKSLGVRHVRDTLAPNRPDQLAAIKQLAVNGVRSELILNGDTSGGGGPTVDPGQISDLTSVAAYTEAVEPTNEYDCSNDSSWAPHLHAYAQNLRDTLAGSPQLAHMGVLAPAFCKPEDVAAYGSVAGTATTTNGHDYAGGLAPELALEARVPQWRNIEQPTLAMWLSETGYTNALNAPGSVTESTAADYTVRTLLDAKRLGVARTYLYELRDEKPDRGLADPEQHYGLVRQDGTPKPAYTAVRNLLADVSRGAPSSVTGPGSVSAVPVQITGGGSLVRSLVITDPRGGGQTVALWLAVPLEDSRTHAKPADATQTVRLTLPGLYSATRQQPSRTNRLVPMGAGSAFDVPVNGAVTLVHLAPASVPTRVACVNRPGYRGLVGAFGASLYNTLAPKVAAAWSGAPPRVAYLPSALTSAVRVTNNQSTWVRVPRTGPSWTLTVWERTDPGSASFARFLQVDGVAPWSGLMRTYGLTSDVPSHVQLDAYGLPASGAIHGTEMVGQAQPGTWHLLSLTVSGGYATFAIDGVTAGRVASSAHALTGVSLGGLASGFRGALGGLAVFPRVLTTDQVQQLATAAPVTCR